MELQNTLAMGKPSSYNFKDTEKLDDTVSFPKLNKSYFDGLGAKPKQRNSGKYAKSSGIQLHNKFSPLSGLENNIDSENFHNRSHVAVETTVKQRSVPKVKVRRDNTETWLLIGDGAVANVNMSNMNTLSVPSATVHDITIKIQDVLKRQNPDKLILHVGAVDTQKQQSELLKKDFNDLFKTLEKVTIPIFISGPLPNINGRIGRFSRLLQLNTWLSGVCENSTRMHFIDNFNLFWNRDDLFKGKGPHLNRSGVRQLTNNLFHALRHQNRPGYKIHLQTREERSKDPEKVSAVAAPSSPPVSQTKDDKIQPVPPTKNPDKAATQARPVSPVKDLKIDSDTADTTTQHEPPKDLSPSSPKHFPKNWAPVHNSTPSGDGSLSFPSPQSPMPLRLPQHLESLMQSATKIIALTPRMAIAKPSSPKKYRAPAPPQFTSPAKGSLSSFTAAV